jgi:CubicO group peptidase (beta-lactamase class C family)
MTTDAVFWIASMSKPIASTALMLLVEEGKVRLDDPVGKYLPEFEPRIMAASPDGNQVLLQKPQHPITVRQLLGHRSGMQFKSSLETPTLDVFPLALRVKSYALEPLMAEPGAEFSYSNAGINTAAHIIEVVSGMPYEEFLQRRLFGPLGMPDTTFWPTDAQVARLAKSYKANATATGLEETTISQLHYPLTDHNHRYPMPAGGLFSTAGDLVKFCQMLLNGGAYAGQRFLSAASIQEVTRNQSGPADLGYGYSAYGLGFELQASGAYGHPGAYATDMTIDPRHGLVTIWLVQHAGFPGNGAKSEAAFQQLAVRDFAN